MATRIIWDADPPREAKVALERMLRVPPCPLSGSRQRELGFALSSQRPTLNNHNEREP